MGESENIKLKQAVMSLVEPERYADVLHGGCVSGVVGGLCYYSQTVKFHDEHETAIWDLVNEEMEAYGETSNMMAFIASWNGAKDIDSMEQFKNLLTWFAVETIVRRLSDETENMVCKDCGKVYCDFEPIGTFCKQS